MDGIHDVGGMEGFGPVRATYDNDNFRDFEDWEQRMWALSRLPALRGTHIDWFRHVVELMLPKDYLTYPYFNKWCATVMVIMADNGKAQITDFKASDMSAEPVPRPSVPASDVEAIIEAGRIAVIDFEVPSDEPAKLVIGQSVRTLRHMPSGHTRLPRYARDAVGQIIAHHGCHPLPDKGAEGIELPEHLYTVRFDAQALWGPDANPHDSVTLDLWESYLVPA